MKTNYFYYDKEGIEYNGEIYDDGSAPIQEILVEKFNNPEVDEKNLIRFLELWGNTVSGQLHRVMTNLQKYPRSYRKNEYTLCGTDRWVIENNYKATQEKAWKLLYVCSTCGKIIRGYINWSSNAPLCNKCAEREAK